MRQLHYIDTQEDLVTAAEELSKHNVLGVDIECENNLHYYGTFITLIQVSNEKHDWIIDVLALGSIDPLIKILEDPKIIKIFHDADFDLRILYSQCKCRPTNLFDTKVGAQLIGEEAIGLGSLLEKFFSKKKEKKFQMADWTRRPLTNAMIEYARGDTQYLIKLRAIIVKRLGELRREKWVKQECEHIEAKKLEYREGEFIGIKGLRALQPKERARVKHLFIIRDKLAQKANRPVHYIMSNAKMFEIAKRPPGSVMAWKSIKATHPTVKKHAKLFFETLDKHRNEQVHIPKNPRKFHSHKQSLLIDALRKERDELATKFKLGKHLIISNEQIREIVEEDKSSSLRPWQKELIAHVVQALKNKS
jgi:ribonuclease D